MLVWFGIRHTLYHVHIFAHHYNSYGILFFPKICISSRLNFPLLFMSLSILFSAFTIVPSCYIQYARYTASREEKIEIFVFSSLHFSLSLTFFISFCFCNAFFNRISCACHHWFALFVGHSPWLLLKNENDIAKVPQGNFVYNSMRNEKILYLCQSIK